MIITIPASILSIKESEALTEHYKNKLKIGFEQGQKARVYDPVERAQMGALYTRLNCNGYAVAGVDKFGRLTYSKRMKSAVERMLEQGLAA